jgi:predicted ATP-dependent serine protease
LRPSTDLMAITFKTKEYPTISTGIPLLDQILVGGFRKDSIIHLYGDPGAGKSTFAMQVMISIMRQGWHAIWVDCNGTFSIRRFQELLQGEDQLLKNLALVRPSSFHQQTAVIAYLKSRLDRVGLLVVDPITHFYRAERFKEASQGYFHELISKQLASLTGIAHLHKIPVIVINYGTRNEHGQTVPLARKGFERVERYRFYFQNELSDKLGTRKVLHIQNAIDKLSRNRSLPFSIGTTGITSIHLYNPQEDPA